MLLGPQRITRLDGGFTRSAADYQVRPVCCCGSTEGHQVNRGEGASPGQQGMLPWVQPGGGGRGRKASSDWGGGDI